MNKVELTALGMALCVGAAVLTGCDRDDDIEYSSDTPAYGANQTYQNDAPTTLADAGAARSAESDASSRIEPHKPLALHATVQFEEGSTDLNEEAKEELEHMVDQMKNHDHNYLTIRLQDGDLLDVTDPTARVEALNQERTDELMNYLKAQDVDLAGVAIDESGEVANYGEGNPMARPDTVDAHEEAQYATITIESEDDNI